MGLNSNTINSQSINGPGTLNSFTGTITPISIEQDVANIGSGEIISFEQSVEFRLSSTVAESLVSIEQNIQATQSGNVISILQTVKDPAVVDHYTRTGWDMTLTIGGYVIPKSQIIGTTKIVRTENTAALMDVELLPPSGVQDLESYVGKTITLDARTSDGIYRIYTGVVDIPEVDVIDEKIILRCTDRRTEQLNDQLPGIIDTIGVYSDRIFSEPEDTAQEVEQRLTTTPKAVDFDAYGNYTITSWFPKTTADFSLTGADVYRDKPRVQYTSRGRIVNKVNIGIQYRYERFYHTTRTFSWESPIADDNCLFFQYGYSLTTRAAIRQAIEASGWPVKGEIQYDEIMPSGWYTCGTALFGWNTVQNQGESVAVTDDDGNEVTDSNGDTVYKTSLTNSTDYAKIYCLGASWQGTSQWSQTVTEDYSLSVSASQSIAQYGEIARGLNYAVDGEVSGTEWENYESFRSVQATNNYYIDQDAERSEVNSAISVALQQAKTIILGSHRDTRVMFDRFLWPAIDLKHTVELSSDQLDAKGKVYSIQHVINNSTTEAVTTVELALFRAQGSASDDPLAIPSKPSDSVTFNTQNILLGNHFGEDPTVASAASWNGMIGNAWIQGTDYRFTTQYQEQFIVDTPAISDSLRLERTLQGSSSYNVEIPNNTLTITFDGKP